MAQELTQARSKELQDLETACFPEELACVAHKGNEADRNLNVACTHCGTKLHRSTSQAEAYKEHFCNISCKAASQAARSLDAFWSKSKLTTNGCLEWQLHTDKDGYGRTKVSQRELGAHQLAWELTNGPIAKGLCVLHKCDNPRCVNPEHLFLGTNKDNSDDKVRKGRQGRPDRKVTPAMKIAICESSDSQRVIAQRFHISEITVWRYRNNVGVPKQL